MFEVLFKRVQAGGRAGGAEEGGMAEEMEEKSR